MSLWQPTVFFSIAASCSVHHPCICRDTDEFRDICLISVRKGNRSRRIWAIRKIGILVWKSKPQSWQQSATGKLPGTFCSRGYGRTVKRKIQGKKESIKIPIVYATIVHRIHQYALPKMQGFQHLLEMRKDKGQSLYFSATCKVQIWRIAVKKTACYISISFFMLQ